MFSKKSVLRALLGSLLAVTLAACGMPGTPTLTVSPTTASFTVGDAGATFTATLTDSSDNIAWTLDPAVGSLSTAAGSTTVYTPPATIGAATTVTLTATAGTLTASATITVNQQTIAEIAVEDGRFETLVAALTAAGLVGTFADASEGPFTVFAPTDLAFDALPAGTLEALLGDIPALTNILLYHVLDGDVRAADVIAAAPFEAETLLEDATISVEVVDGGVVLNGTVNVIITDIVASNGVIHVIDAVLLPPTP
jgi:uncharacterized surface protein with fasciclin (FAS1) repeats